MTEYTESKRRLQRLGFKVTRRIGDRDVILEKGGTKIRLAADRCGHEAMYAATENDIPVSWHNASRRCSAPGKWMGFNYEIEVTPEEDFNDKERELFYTMYSIAHVGHYTAAIDRENLF